MTSTPPLALEGEIPTATELETRVQAARQAHRERLTRLASLNADTRRLQADVGADVGQVVTLWDVVRAAFGPGEVGPRLSTWLQRVQVFSSVDDPGLEPAVLEDRVQTAQDRVIELAHHIDRLSLERAALAGEIQGIQGEVDQLHRDVGRLEAALSAVQRELDQLAESSHGPAPRDAAARHARESGLQARELELESQRRAADRAITRLSSVSGLHQHFLDLNRQIERNLTRLHSAAATVLDALDHELMRMAAQNQAKDVAEEIAHSMGALRSAVARVNRVADEGGLLMTEELDRLSAEVDLLAPVDPAALAAEAEVSDLLAGGGVPASLRRRLSEKHRGEP